ncbi:MAG: SRPBCC domain-containing protein [Microbacter sp.]
MKNLKKQFIIKASPQDVYAAFTKQEMIAMWTGEEAVMTPEAGTEFAWWGGDICGENIEFEENRKIVQKWYFEEDEIMPSIVTLKMHPHKQGTSLEINHINIPDEAFENIVEGWIETVVPSLRILLEDE